VVGCPFFNDPSLNSSSSSSASSSRRTQTTSGAHCSQLTHHSPSIAHLSIPAAGLHLHRLHPSPSFSLSLSLPLKTTQLFLTAPHRFNPPCANSSSTSNLPFARCFICCLFHHRTATAALLKISDFCHPHLVFFRLTPSSTGESPPRPYAPESPHQPSISHFIVAFLCIPPSRSIYTLYHLWTTSRCRFFLGPHQYSAPRD